MSLSLLDCQLDSEFGLPPSPPVSHGVPSSQLHVSLHVLNVVVKGSYASACAPAGAGSAEPVRRAAGVSCLCVVYYLLYSIRLTRDGETVVSESDSSKPADVDRALWEETLQSSKAFGEASQRKYAHANRIYWALFIYLIVVILNAFGVVLLFFLTALSYISVPYELLAGWARYRKSSFSGIAQ